MVFLEQLRNVHSPEACAGHPCCIHNPSDHPLNRAPLSFRLDRNLLPERTCYHGVGHPDPDGLDFIRRTQGPARANADSIHGCDGCC